jgi:hypothetical protein
MTASNGRSTAPNDQLISALNRAHAQVTSDQRHLLEIIAECDEFELWRQDGARDTAQWLAAHLGISCWAAHRYVTAAHALPGLPRTKEAFESGRLSLDKLLELCRFATSETERKLLSWAQRVSPAAIRRRADASKVSDIDDVREADRTRYVRSWSFDEGRRLGLEGSFAADQGALVMAALDLLAGRLPPVISEDDQVLCPTESLEARRAGALVACASAQIADDHDADRATVVVHAELEALSSRSANADLERGPVIHPETPCALPAIAACSACSRTQTVTPWASDARLASCPAGCNVSSSIATGGVCSPAVGRRPFSMPITSSTGFEAAQPSSTTSGCCVPITTSWSTSTGGGWC